VSSIDYRSENKKTILLEKLQLAAFVDRKENDFLIWEKNKIAEFFSHKVIVEAGRGL